MKAHAHAQKIQATKQFNGSSISELCEKDVVSVKPSNTVLDAAKLMRKNHIGDVLVIDDKDGKSRPIGIITDRDIVIETTAKQLPPDSVKISALMTQDIVTANENDGIYDLVRIMKEKGVSRLPIVDDSGGLVGILSSKRLFQFLAQGLCDLSSLSEQQREREHLRH